MKTSVFWLVFACSPVVLVNCMASSDDNRSTDEAGGGKADDPNGTTAGPPPSCAAAPDICGASGTENCCRSDTLPGGTYDRMASFARPALATVSPFRLDTYEITVSRFRAFVEAGMGTRATAPAAGTGAHPLIPGSGWDPAWTAALPADTAALRQLVANGPPDQQDPNLSTWTDQPGANENKPINQLSWQLAFAFCVWDHGRLPTDAEWGFAAMGGEQDRAYAWSNPPASTTIDGTYASYHCNVKPGVVCPNPDALYPVGTFSPKGDGRWGTADLTGNASEWVLDFYQDLFENPPACDDCAQLTPSQSNVGSGRVFRGGAFDLPDTYVLNAARGSGLSLAGSAIDGARCARNP